MPPLHVGAPLSHRLLPPRAAGISSRLPRRGAFEAFPPSPASSGSFPCTFPSRSPSLPPRPRRVTPLPADPVLPPLWNASASFFPASSRPLLFPPGLLFILAMQMLPHVWVFVGRCADNTEQLPRARLRAQPPSSFPRALPGAVPLSHSAIWGLGTPGMRPCRGETGHFHGEKPRRCCLERLSCALMKGMAQSRTWSAAFPLSWVWELNQTRTEPPGPPNAAEPPRLRRRSCLGAV